MIENTGGKLKPYEAESTPINEPAENTDTAGLPVPSTPPRRATLEQTPSAAEQLIVRDAAWREERARNKEVRDYTWEQTRGDIWNNSLSGSIVNNVYDFYQSWGAQETPLSESEWEAMVKEAQEGGLPEAWLEELQDVRTAEEFQRVLARSKEHIAAAERLNSTWGSFGANLLASYLDPAGWPLAAGIVTPIMRSARAAVAARSAAAHKGASIGLASGETFANVAKANRRELIGSSALSGALAAGSNIAAVDAAGQAPTPEEYLFASLVGVGLGAAVGPLTAKSATREEAKMLARAAQRALKAGGYDAQMKALGVKPPMIDPPLALPHPDQFKVQPEVSPGQPFRARTADDFLPDAPAAHAKPVTKIVDPTELEPTPDLLKNPRFIARYEGGDGAEYRIVAETEDMSGPYRVVSGGKVIARNVDRIQDARAVIPKRTVEEMPPAPEAPTAPNIELIEQLRTALANATDEAAAKEVSDMLDSLQGFVLENMDDLDEAAVRALTPNEPKAAGAAPTPEELTGHTFIDDNLIRSIRDEDVPYSAVTAARTDRAAFSLKSRNPIRRWLGWGLLDDTVGNVDKNRVTPHSAELDARQKADKWIVPYEQAREAQFKAWAGAMGINRLKQPFVRDQFYVAVGERINGLKFKDNVPQAARDAIDALIPHIDRLGKELAEDAKNPLREFGKVTKPLPGADEWDAIPGKVYMPTRWDATKIQYAVENGKISETGLIRLIQDAIEKAQPNIDKRYLQRLSAGFATNIRNRAFGIEDEWTISFNGRDRRRFVAALQRDTGLSPAEVEDLAKTIFDRKPDPSGVFGNHKRRVLMDYTHVDPKTGIRVADFLDMNVDRLFQSAVHRLSGRVALARMQLTMPKKPRFKTVLTRDPKTGNSIATKVEDGHTGGDILLDGIRTDDELEAVIQAASKWEAEFGDNAMRDNAKYEVEKIRWVYDRLMGRPDPAHTTKPAKVMRNIRDYNFMRLMWSVPISMMNEYVMPLSVLGIKAGTSHAPAWRRVVDASGRTRYRTPLHDQIEAMGIGRSRLHKASLRGLEHFQGNEEMALTGSRWDRVTENLAFGTRLTAQYSGMMNLQAILEHHAAASVLQRLADMADLVKAGKKFGPEDMARWKALGLDDEMAARVMENFRHADKTDGFFFPGKLTSLNLDKWDADVSMALQHLVYRYARKLIQQQSYGNTALWMGKPLAQTFFQFRNFPFTAYNNHLLHNLHQRDAAALKMFIFGTTWAAMVRGMQVKMLAALRPDGDEYEEKHGNLWALAKAGFSRSTMAATSPMVIDTLLFLMDRPGMFDARSTGQASDILGGSPTISAFNQLAEGVSGTTGSWIDNREMSQMELRALGGLLPGATIPFMSAFGHLIKDRPVKAPKVEASF